MDKDEDNLLQSLLKNEEFDTIPVAPVQQLLKNFPEIANLTDAHGFSPLAKDSIYGKYPSRGLYFFQTF